MRSRNRFHPIALAPHGRDGKTRGRFGAPRRRLWCRGSIGDRRRAADGAREEDRKLPGDARNRRGIMLMIAAIGLITAVDVVAKVMTADLHAVMIAWGYFLGIVLHLVAYVAAAGKRAPRLIATRRPVLQIARAGCLVGSIASLFVGYTYLPLADVTAIGFVAPLLITAMSVPLLGERVGIHRWAAVLLGLAGVLVIVRPGGGIAHWAAIMPLISATCFACYQIATRRLAATERTFATLFYTGVGGFLLASLAVGFFWRTPTPGEWAAFLALGTLGVGAHLCLISAFGVAQASVLAPFNYTKLVWAAALGYVLFDEFPTANTLAGSALVVASGLYVIYREGRRVPAVPAAGR